MRKIKCICSVIVAVAMMIQILPGFAESGDIKCQIDWNDEHQTIDGFGGSLGGYRGSTSILMYPELADFLFDRDKGIGVSIIRATINGSSEGNSITIEPEENQWYWEGDKYQIELMKKAQDQYGIKIIATPWSPPYWMKSNNSTIRGTLREDKYQAYAEYLAAYVKGYKEHFGIDIYGLSLQNEPESETSYESSLLTGEQYRVLMKDYMIPTFKKENIASKIILPEAANFEFSRAKESMDDPEVAEQIGILSAHAYNGSYARYAKGKEMFKPLWDTEFCDLVKDDPTINHGLKMAETIHTYMVVPEVNAFMFWYLAISGYPTAEGLISINNNVCTMNKRVYTFGNYCKFIRPGYVRINADDNPAADLFITSYKNPETNDFVTVVVNDSTETNRTTFNLNGFRAEMADVYRTSETENLESVGQIAIDGDHFTTEFMPHSVTTFVSKAKDISRQSGKIEAENGTVKIGNAQNYGNSNFSGGKGVKAIGAKDNGVSFKNVSAANSLVFRYASTYTENYNLYINGNFSQTVTFGSTVNFGVATADKAIAVAVPEGAEVKLLSVDDGEGIQIDYMQLFDQIVPSDLTLQTVEEVEEDNDYQWAESDVKLLEEKGLVSDIDAFPYGEYITRGNYVSLLVKSLNLETDWEENFFDAKDKEDYYQGVGIAKELGIIKGEGNLFYPDELLSREDLFIITSNAMQYLSNDKAKAEISGFKDYDELSQQGADAVSYLVGKGIVNGTGDELQPKNKVNYAQAAVLISRVLQGR